MINVQGESGEESERERERNRKNRGWIQLFFEMILDDKNEFLRYNLHTTTSINELRFLGNCAELECGRERERERSRVMDGTRETIR